MKIDTYTKFLLTVITLCLIYLCAKESFRVPVVRADAPVRIILVDGENNPIAEGDRYVPHGAPLSVSIQTK